MIDALYGVLTLLAVFTVACVPLVAVLPSSPPLNDSTSSRTPRAGWRITIIIGRCDGLKASTYHDEEATGQYER